MPFFRILSALAVAAFALWIIVGEQLSGASADATINGQIVTLRARVAGDLRVSDRFVGSRVEIGEAVASVTDDLVDGVRLDDLVMEFSFATAEVDRAAALVAQTEAIMADMTARRDTYRVERVAEITVRLERAKERLAILESGGTPEGAGADLSIAEDSEAGRVPLEPRLPELWLNFARERVEVLEIALRAAESGVFLGDGYNDAPNAEQRLVELQSELAAQKATATEAVARQAAVSARLDAERRRVNLAASSEITSPVNGLYWEALAAGGITVQRGDPIARLLDCDSVVVTASVSEAVYNRLMIGDEVTFRPSGASTTYKGSILRLAGAGAETVYRDLAIAPSQKHLERYDVMIDVPGLRSDADLTCAIGRTGRVFFDARPLDLLRGLWN